MSKIFPATKGAKYGICNICGKKGSLTEDHTPPKGCIKIRAVQLQHILNHLNVEKPAGRGRILQNGVKYRTLCHECNNTLLGANYDPSFISFVNGVGEYLRTNLELSSVIPIEVEPQKVMRALLGHLAAQGVNRYEKGIEPLRDYFLDPTLFLPEYIKIYYWLYPYKEHVMARDCAYLDLNVKKPYVVWFLKFFPIAFMVTFNQPKELTLNVSELSKWRDKKIDFKTIEYVKLTELPHQYWPEAPTERNVIAYGQEAVVSYEYKSIKTNKNR